MLVPRKGSYTPNEELRLSCPEGVKPSFTSAKCVREFQGVTSGEPVYGDSWWGRRGRGAWTRIEEPVACVGTWGSSPRPLSALTLPPQPLLGAAVPCRLLRSSPLRAPSFPTAPCDAAVLGSAPLGFPHGLGSGLPEPPAYPPQLSHKFAFDSKMLEAPVGR